MREEVEGLKDHAGPQTQLALLLALIARSWRMAAGDRYVTDSDRSRIGDFEFVQATQKGAFAATARANYHTASPVCCVWSTPFKTRVAPKDLMSCLTTIIAQPS